MAGGDISQLATLMGPKQDPVDMMNERISRIQPPEWARPNALGMVDFSLDETKSKELDSYYGREIAKITANMQLPDEQTKAQREQIQMLRESTSGRIVDPDYSLTGDYDYSRVMGDDEIRALAKQRAADYEGDMRVADVARKYEEEDYKRAMRERQVYEESRLKDSQAMDAKQRRADRDRRRSDFKSAPMVFKTGQSLLALDDIKDEDLKLGRSVLF